jgi:hypothetical protein
MMSKESMYDGPKISYEFEARLKRLKPEQQVRAIVLLQTQNTDPAATRPSRADRQKVISAVRHAAQAALPEIDRILKNFRGQRLDSGVNALGSIAVETTVEGIHALAASEHVKAILEDQPISLPAKLKRA